MSTVEPEAKTSASLAPTGSASLAPAGSAASRPSQKRKKGDKSFADKYIPKLAVYFPKFVCINNSRLAILYYVLIVGLIVCIVVYFMVEDTYKIDTTPWARSFIYAKPLTAAQMDTMAAKETSDVCTNAGTYSLGSNVPTGCVSRCGSGSIGAGEMCIHPTDMIENEASMVFVPTYIAQTVAIPLSGASCPSGYSLMNDLSASVPYCHKKNMMFVPGAGGVGVEFSHSFTNRPKQGAWLFATEDLRRHSRGAGELGMKTVLIGHSGEIIKTYEKGDVINPTVNELLTAAEYDEVGPRGTLSLDQVFARPTFGMEEDVILRMTGATLTVVTHVTDEGKCYHSLSEKEVKLDGSGIIACMYVTAERMWTSSGKHQTIGTNGAFVDTHTSGIRVKFKNTGLITAFDLTTLLTLFTVAFVWIQIPLQVVYYFTVYCLGHLSSIYSRVIHQDLHLAEACKGLASRLVSHSAAYMDLQDQTTGITKGRLLDRFRKVLESNKNIDDVEIVKFVDFVFEGMQSLSQAATTDTSSDTINIQEYCSACSTNEPLDFDSLVRLFDKDRKIGCLEGCFLDDSIRSVVRSAKTERPSQIDQASQEQEEAQAQLIQQLYQLSDLTAKASDTDKRAKMAMKDCENSMKESEAISSKASIIAASRKAAGKHVIDPVCDFKVTQEPKPDQRESEGSIADEEEPGR